MLQAVLSLRNTKDMITLSPTQRGPRRCVLSGLKDYVPTFFNKSCEASLVHVSVPLVPPLHQNSEVEIVKPRVPLPERNIVTCREDNGPSPKGAKDAIPPCLLQYDAPQLPACEPEEFAAQKSPKDPKYIIDIGNKEAHRMDCTDMPRPL